MKLLNFIWTPEGATMANMGPEGEYWTRAKEGETGLVGTPALFDIDFQPPTPFTRGWNQLGPIYQSEEWRNSIVAKSPFTPDGSGSGSAAALLYGEGLQRQAAGASCASLNLDRSRQVAAIFPAEDEHYFIRQPMDRRVHRRQ